MHLEIRILTILTAVLCTWFAGCEHYAIPVYHDNLVAVTRKGTINFLAVHSGTARGDLTIWGRNYKNVRGKAPFYLDIQGKPMILFVTGRTYDGGQAIVHLANTSNHTIVDFPAHDSHIGSQIGDDEYGHFERLLKVEGNLLSIEASAWNGYYRYFIDLSIPRFEREEAKFEDSHGKISRYVLERGKWPK